MCNLLEELVGWLINLDTLVDLSAIGTFILACFALRVWRKQEKSKRTVELFDKLTDAIHACVHSISHPIQKLEFIYIGIDSCQYDQNIDRTLEFPEAICFIEKGGRDRAKELFEALQACRESSFVIRSLITKGQVMNIKNFAECYDACQLIAWQYDRLQAFAGMLGMRNTNWQNQEVIDRLRDILDITPDSIRGYLDKNQTIYLNYVKDTYTNEYGRA